MSAASSAEWATTVGIGDIAVVLAVAGAFSWAFTRLRQPAVIGEIVAGICLGPSLLGLLPGDLPSVLFPPEVKSLLGFLAQVGILLFMFVIGWEFEPGRVRGRLRSTGAIWVCSMALPMLLGAGLALLLYDAHRVVNGHTVGREEFVLYMAVAMSISAFPVLARIISEKGLNRSRAGALALTLAAADDVLAWCFLAVVVARVTADDAYGLIAVALWSGVFVVGMFVVVRPLARVLAQRCAARGSVAFGTSVAAVGLFASSYVTSVIGIHAIFGAFLFGVVLPRESALPALLPVRTTMEQASRLLMPVFFVTVGLKVDLTSIMGTGLGETLLIILVAVVGKLAGVALPARVGGMDWNDSVTLGLLMNTRGLTELIVLNVGLSLGLMTTELFTSMVVMALVTTAMAGPLLSLLRPPVPVDPGDRAVRVAEG
ncbi:cation:proton antiporter [Streptomyces sp. ODS05-4]|uniref:cation:proton antiporter n=1 Tax=Streptomyces sp. ODS05-4 TaxID=2944939 RepID=UPI00210F0A13|nr:cation:proton antiporter [Streptomyces sp. ODS05-4]